MDRDMMRRSGAWAAPPGSQQCRGTGVSLTLRQAFESGRRELRCIVFTGHPSGLCGFCRRTEAG